MADVPGTVSQILWHFTGGPTWNKVAKCQNRTPKTAADAYKALVGILESRELRLGSFKEVVKVRIPELRKWNPDTKRYRTERDVRYTIESVPICCLADIPIVHLSYHANRYGKFAIGFHRDAAIRHGFNPVFYTLQHSSVIRRIRRGFADIRALNLRNARFQLKDIESAVDDAPELDLDFEISELESELDNFEDELGEAAATVEQFLAFVKTFDAPEFQSVYCEREWRSVSCFRFSYDDVAMIVLPQRVGMRRYFETFVEGRATLGLPPGIPIVPWETLLES